MNNNIISFLRKSEWGTDTNIGFILLTLLIISGSIIIVLSFYDVQYYKWLIKEDGIIECASAIFWFIAAIIIIIHLLTTPIKNKKHLCVYILLMLFFLACCGEEISWGQRLFHLRGPDIIISINKQKELNIHDIGHISIFSNLFFLIFVSVFFYTPIFMQKSIISKILLKK